VLDLPVAIAVAAFLIFVLLRRGKRAFVLACHAASTFGAQFSAFVTISLVRVLPIAIAPFGLRRGSAGLSAFGPFAVYSLVVTALGSFSWEIPRGIAFFYGDGRVYVQLFNLAMLILATRATAFALSDKDAVKLLWRYLTVVMLIHGIASLYQLIAVFVGLPAIGISRPFNLTAGDSEGDVAAFATSTGMIIARPGGLAGEPKGMAAMYGAYIASYLFGGRALLEEWRERVLMRATLSLSLIGFLAAFSTSAIIGGAVAIVVCTFLLGTGRIRSAFVYVPALAALGITVWLDLTHVQLQDFGSVFQARTTGRLEEGAMDPPVEASIQAFLQNPLIGAFGTGMGGSSFIVMKYLHETFQYAYAPNIGIVLLLVELGTVGTVLLLFPIAQLLWRASALSKATSDATVGALVALSLSTMIFCLTGSGNPLGIPLAIAAAVGALAISAKAYNEKRERL
jgi:hypothetical protein